MMSKACQKRLKQRKRWRISWRNPLAENCAIIVPSQRSPALTCTPWHPTRVKKDERNALRPGPAPWPMKPANSRTSRTMKARPRRPVARRCRDRSPPDERSPVDRMRDRLRGAAPARSSGRLPVQRRGARSAVGAIDSGHLLGRDFDLVDITPGEDYERHVGANESEYHQPPDLPDQGEPGRDGEERRDESGRTVARHLDGRVLRLGGHRMPDCTSPLLDCPVRVVIGDLGQDSEIAGG